MVFKKILFMYLIERPRAHVGEGQGAREEQTPRAQGAVLGLHPRGHPRTDGRRLAD